MKNLVIIQTVVPDYRKGFFNAIENALDQHFELYGGDFYFEKSVKSDCTISKKRTRNYFIFNNKLLFQTGIWHLLFKDVILVLEMNPRILSNWVFLIIRKIINRKTVLWGHAWPRKSAFSKSDNIRNLMRLLANKIIVYTRQQQHELKIKMPKKIILAAPNAVLSSSKMEFSMSDNKFNIIYVGRLTKLKKPLFLVKSFASEIHKYPPETKLIIIGEGEEKNIIKNYIVKKKLSKRIELLGHISDYEKLKELYFTSFFSVSPGYVGLSITQSFGFGVPMLVSREENHSPEIEALNINENGLFFETNNEYNFNQVLLNAFKESEMWNDKGIQIVEFCQKNYSTESMAETFIKLAKNES
ncbi:glycosyltransferase family 4 protein [Flavobacteriaceae bacterium]|nr:glycosyltransferase family 4 protein [Flavobacteriaceae bacterium]